MNDIRKTNIPESKSEDLINTTSPQMASGICVDSTFFQALAYFSES